jgi:hypothetical protein
MPRNKHSKRLDRKTLDYKERPYKNALADASFFLNPDFARAAALTLHGQADYDRAIEKAFDAFGLDPNKPHHWRTLLGILADILFGERGKGPKLRWSSETIKQLISDFDDLSSNHPEVPQMDLFEFLTHTKRRYAGLQAGTLKARYNEGKGRLGMTRRGGRSKVERSRLARLGES